MITYNHEEYVRQAISSVFQQETSFFVQLVVGDDSSVDNTPEIIESLVPPPHVDFRRILRKTNLGMLRNFTATLAACEGEYVALLEGDDYWSDVKKLQKQIDFLDSNPEFSMCFHPVKIQLADGSVENDNNQTLREVSDIYDLARGNFMHTCSVVFRARLFNEFPESFYKSTVGDYFLHMLNAQFGKIGRLPETMGVYRVHPGGVWSMKPNMDLKILTYLEAMVGIFDSRVDELLRERHKKIATSSFFDRINQEGFDERLYRATRYGCDEFEKRLLEQLDSGERDGFFAKLKKMAQSIFS